MSLTSRQKRPLDREIPHLRDTKLIIIVTEGTNTEKQYFESDLFKCPRIQVKVFETQDNKSAPIHVFKRLKSLISKLDLWPDDQIWLMVDKDRWPGEQVDYVCSHAIRGKRKANLAVSNPCFELWLYLHFDSWTNGSCSSRDMEGVLRNKLGSYNKSNIDISKYVNGITEAIGRAKLLDKNPSNRWPENPGTQVYKVVEEIKKKTAKN